ncbi:MAG: DAK2 domain-containing protein [Chloroflexota bacterium]
MVVEMKQTVVDGRLMKWLIAAGVNWLEYHKNKINEMNVFPVPDGDTGTNMLLTIRKAYQQVQHMEEKHVGILMEQVARGALTGARGNSGTILSMLLRGFSQELKNKEVIDAPTFARACKRAVDYAYETVESVMEPVEGTILTVAREATDAIKDLPHNEMDLKTLLEQFLAAAQESLQNTPNLLPKLKEAGVVDSGGMGLVTIIQGMKRFIEGEPVVMEADQTRIADDSMDWEAALEPDDEEGYGYDVQFLMLGDNLDVKQVRQDISDMGWSPLVDGDETMIKVHIHVHNPADPLDYAIKSGADLDDIVVENMQAQYLQYVQQRSEREAAVEKKTVEGVAVVTVGRGDGLERLLEEYGAAYVIIGGQTMNPSTEDFMSAIEDLPNNDIILMPNNSNVIMAAEQAASLVENKNVRVVRSKTVQQGIVALIAYMDANDDDATVDSVKDAMSEAITLVTSVDVTTATRNANIDNVDVAEGQFIGMVNNRLSVSGDDLLDVIVRSFEKADADDCEIVTVYYGAGKSEADAEALVEALSETYADLEYEIVYGGQPLYPYLISLE